MVSLVTTIASAEPVVLTDYAVHKKGEDWAPAIKKAFSDSPVVKVPPGRYFCSQVKFTDGMTLQGSGGDTVFIPLGTRLFDISGEVGDEIPINNDIVDFSNIIHLKDTGGLSAGDDILIRGQRNSMLREGTAGTHYTTDWVLGRTRTSSCFYGEFDVVSAIDGNKITTSNNRLFPDYFKDDTREPPPPGEGFIQRESTTVSNLSLVKNVTLRNFTVEGTKKCHMPFRLRYAQGCLLEGITFRTSVESFKKDGTPDLSVVYAIYVLETTVRNFRAELAPELLAIIAGKEKVYKNFSNYNLFKIISSARSGFENCQANGGTHAFNITRSASAGAGGGITSVDCFVRDSTASNCIWSGIKIQQACYRTDVTGNTVTASDQGIITCARETRIENNRLTTTAPHSTNAYYTHINRGGTMGIGLIEGYACGSIVRNNIVSGFYSGLAVVDGYEDKNCFEEGDILFENNTIDGCVRGFTLYKNPHCETLGQNVLNITLRKNNFTRTPSSDAASSAGVHLHKESAGISVSGNVFHGFSHGVWLDGVFDHIKITDNRFTDCEAMIGSKNTDFLLNEGKSRIHENANTLSKSNR